MVYPVRHQFEIPPIKDSLPKHIPLIYARNGKVEVKFENIASMCVDLSFSMNPEVARRIAYLINQGADHLEGLIGAQDDNGYTRTAAMNTPSVDPK